MVEGVVSGSHRLPEVFLPDGSLLVQPELRALAEKTRLQTQASQPFYGLTIVGAGPAGPGAAVYGASEWLITALIEREATGGQVGSSSRIESYLGFPKSLSGADLARLATDQAACLGAEILTAQEIERVSVQDPYRIVTLKDGSTLGCKALIITTSVTVRRLEAPGVEKPTGAGIYYGAAISEAAYYRNRHVVVVSGANSAGQAAMFFSRYASQVTMLACASALESGMSHYLVDQIHGTSNLRVLLTCEVTRAMGKQRLESIDYSHRDSGEPFQKEAAALFIFFSAVPHSQMVSGMVACNNAGFIIDRLLSDTR